MVKEFNKTRELTQDELKDLLVSAAGKAIKLNDFPDNTHIVAKIVDEPKVRKYPTDDTDDAGNVITKDIPYFNLEYKFNEKKVPLFFRVSLGAYNNFLKNNEGKEYLHKYAIFTKAKIDGKNMHSIGAIYKEGFEPQKFVDPLTIINSSSSAEEVKQQSISKDAITEWVNNYRNSVKKFNDLLVKQGSGDDVKPITLESCAYQYFRKHYGDEFIVIADMFKQ